MQLRLHAGLFSLLGRVDYTLFLSPPGLFQNVSSVSKSIAAA